MEENTAPETRPAGVGPGDRLQAARIQKGLSIEDVAARMHLSTGILEAIEENNFDEITAPIFVKGYLRAYARIVSLDEDEMIRQYIDYYSDEDPPISSTANVTPELSVTDARIRWTTYLVVIVLAVLLAAWWWNKGRDEEPAISLDAQAPVAEPSASVSPGDAGSGIQAASESLPQETAPTVPVFEPPVSEAAPTVSAADPIASDSTKAAAGAVDPQPAAAVTGSVADASESAPDVAMTEAAPLEAEATTLAAAVPPAEIQPDLQPGAGPAETAADAPAAPTAPGLPNTPGLIAPVGNDRMRIVVNDDTWADIKDGSGYQMVYDLLRAEQTLELVGQAPFSVFLGNGPGVEILINDEAYEFSSRIRSDNTARLKVGG